MARQLIAAPETPSTEDDARPTVNLPWWRRLWRAPVAAHATVLAVILLALIPVVGTGVSFSADEGAAIIQARSLARGDGWLVDHPVPEADADGRNYPLELSARGPRGTAPFAKHPLYPLLLAGADRVGGTAAMVLLSLAGTVAAAALAAALAARIDPTLARPSLWAVGVGSPLLFDGYLVIAHTLGAALAAGAVLCAVHAVEHRRRRPAAVGGVFACVLAAALLRSEATLFAVALALAVSAAVALRRRGLGGLGAAGASIAAAGMARGLEGRWVRHIVGGPSTTTGSFDVAADGLSARLRGFRLTWLTPSYTGRPAHDLALLVMLALVVAAAVLARRRPGDRAGVFLLAGTAAGAAWAALALDPDALVPGLLVTLPVAAAGVALLRRQSLRSPAATVAAVTFTVFALAVLATQYPQGGSGEWGGRYFAMGLPLLVPLALAGLAGQRGRSDRVTASAGIGALVACTAAVSVMALTSLSSNHRFTGDLMARIGRGGEQVGDRPVMVATSGAVPRLAWATFDRQRWLLADDEDHEDLPGLVHRLRAAGVARFALVTNRLPVDGARLDRAGARVLSRDGRPDGGEWQVLVVATG